MDKETYIKKWLDGSLEGEERKAFEQTEDFKSLEKLSKALTSFSAPTYNIDAAYEKIRHRLKSRNKVVMLNWVNPLLKIAAILILLVGSYFYFLHNPSTIIKTLASQQTKLWLPDSSYVALNSQSQISFDKHKWEKERKVELDGEGYFKVAKGSQFDVITTSGTITVLGTQFNVKNRTDFFEVTCFEGLVEVRHANIVAKLSATHTFRIINGVVTENYLVDDPSPRWIRNESYFRSVPFIQAIQEFERQYNHKVITRNVDTDQLFTGVFTNSNMDLALKTISLPLNLKYQILDKKKIILSSDTK